MRHSTFVLSAVFASTAMLGLYSAVGSADPSDTIPNGRRIGTLRNPPESSKVSGNGGSTASSNGISYHGGPVLVKGAHVYYIWYGNWGTNTATTILPVLPNGLSGSPYFNIETTYYSGTTTLSHIQNFVTLAGQYTWATEPYGTALTDANVQALVASTINGGHLAYDAQGVYFVLTSPEIQETSGFCTSYCGWHTHFPLNGVASNDVKYSFVGNAASQCPSACIVQTLTSPNNNPGADGMANVIAHEIDEAANDPDLNAWYDNTGKESADKCAWTFGTELTAGNGSKYNVTLGGLNFLIQQNWVNANAGYCALSH